MEATLEIEDVPAVKSYLLLEIECEVEQVNYDYPVSQHPETGVIRWKDRFFWEASKILAIRAYSERRDEMIPVSKNLFRLLESKFEDYWEEINAEVFKMEGRGDFDDD